VIAYFLIIATYLLIPAFLLYLCHRIPALDKLGAVALAYILGIVLGTSGLLPDNKNEILGQIGTFAVPIAFPLLLFSMDLRSTLATAGKTVVSMITAMISIVLMVTLGYYLFGSRLEEGYKVAGMLIGVYTGGTPNLASLSAALSVDPETYLITHTYDMMLGAIYLAVLLAFGRRLVHWILPPYIPKMSAKMNNAGADAEGIDHYGGMLRPPYRKPLIYALLLSLAIFAVAGALSLLVPENSRTAVVILLITSLGLLLSLIPRIHAIEKTFQLGMYFIIVFCLAMASMADIVTIFQLKYLYLFYYVALAYFGSIALHVAISALLRIDSDTTLVTSTALLFSPPFVPVVAGALKNRKVIVPGVAVGVLGYAIGNYLGMALAWLLG
jgi:uncharacterized membrane protein